MKIFEKIRYAIETTPGLTQKGLAEQMGVNPAAVNRMLYGRRNIMLDEVPIIEKYLGIRLVEDGDMTYTPPSNAYAANDTPAMRGVSDIPPASFTTTAPGAAHALIPVYGTRGGESGHPHLGLGETDIVDWVQRHPQQAGARGAFAVYMASDAMEPRYYSGELIYVHPGRLPEPGRDCVVVFTSGDAVVRRYLGQTDNSLRLCQHNPPSEVSIKKDKVKAIYAVIGRG